jgi:hypothetical protein
VQGAKALSRLYERMDGVPSGGFVWLGLTWLFRNPLAFVALTLCLCLFPASILMPHFPGLHGAAALFAACTWLAIQDGRFEQAQPSPVQSSTRDGHEHAGINKRTVLTEQAPGLPKPRNTDCNCRATLSLASHTKSPSASSHYADCQRHLDDTLNRPDFNLHTAIQ